MGIAIFGIIAIFLAVWALLMALDPKRWYMWWMAVFGRTGLNTTREQRHRQQKFLSIAGYVAFSLLIGASVISVYYVIVSIQEQRQTRSDYEQAKDNTTLDRDRMRTAKKFRKL